MIHNRRALKSWTAVLLAAAFFAGFLLMSQFLQAQDGLDRLLKQINLVEPTNTDSVAAVVEPTVVNISASPIVDHQMVRPTTYKQDFQFTDPDGFTARGDVCAVPADVYPQPLAYGTTIYDPHRQYNPWNPDSRMDEYVFDGGDREQEVAVDQSWNVYGLNIEDTVGHFDTLDGRRLVTPSNRVAIYAPRFAAVRRVDGLFNAESRVKVGEMEERTQLARAEAQDFSSTTKQHLALERFEGADRASGLINRNRGVVQENVTHLFGIRNTFEPYENLSLIRFGKFESSEGARLGIGLQSANNWQDNLGLQVAVETVQPVITNDVYRVQQLVHIESDDKAAILRVTKVASKIAAKAGEHVDFTIRFDNLTGRKIGNVTIIDNLTGRLEYVTDSAECSVKAEFINEVNESGSLLLRWEITEPLPANTGGIIRFRCRVR